MKNRWTHLVTLASLIGVALLSAAPGTQAACEYNFGVCDGGQCQLNFGTCSGTCDVNLDDCHGECQINIQDCERRQDCTVNVGPPFTGCVLNL